MPEGEQLDESESTRPPVKKFKKKATSSKADELLCMIAKNFKKSIEEHNPYETFGKYVAQTLNGIDAHHAPLAKKLINDVLFEAEKGDITSYSRIVNDSLILRTTVPTLPCGNEKVSIVCNKELTQDFSQFYLCKFMEYIQYTLAYLINMQFSYQF